MSDYNAAGRGFAPHTERPFMGSTSLNVCFTENPTTAEERNAHPTPPCSWPIIMGVSTAPTATLTY